MFGLMHSKTDVKIGKLRIPAARGSYRRYKYNRDVIEARVARSASEQSIKGNNESQSKEGGPPAY